VQKVLNLLDKRIVETSNEEAREEAAPAGHDATSAGDPRSP